jgi:hypothetical protein
MTQDELTVEIQSLAIALEDEFGIKEETVQTIAELLCISHKAVAQALDPVADFG